MIHLKFYLNLNLNYFIFKKIDKNDNKNIDNDLKDTINPYYIQIYVR